MADILSEFALHVGTGTALGPVDGAWHRGEADWREKELRDFIASLAAELRLHCQSSTDSERIAIGAALLEAHPELTAECGGKSIMSDAEEARAKEPKSISIQGMHVNLPSGSQVWGGFHEDSVVWRFTSPSGVVTRLVLSVQAMAAVFQLYQNLLGSIFPVSIEDERSPPQHTPVISTKESQK